MIGLCAALGAAVAFGVAAVLQGVAVARSPRTAGVDPRLLLRLLRHGAFVVAMLLNAAGFVLHLTALQVLPLFLVQAAIASSVGVTAVLAVRVFGTPLDGAQWTAVAAVCIGLALLASAAASNGDAPEDDALRLGLVVALVITTAAAVAVGRTSSVLGAALLGFLGGVLFGIVAIAGRLVDDLAPAALLSDSATYTLVAAGVLAWLLYCAAMQRGSVTTTTAALVLTQTAVPAVVGVVLLGDRVRSGWVPAAVAGFLLALAGAAALARFETVRPVTPR